MIAVTGATGNLGELAINALIKRGVSPKEIVAVVRSKAKAEKLVKLGVQVREATYDNVDLLKKAFESVDKLLFVSGSEVGKRIAQHTNVVQAAKAAGVKLVAYTSILNADSSKMALAPEHLETEKIIKNSGLPYVFLRNSWYIENYFTNIPGTLEHGAILGSTDGHALNAATRADYADAAASVLTKDQGQNKIYELAGAAFTLADLASEFTKASGKKVEYKNLPAAEYSKFLVQVGVPAPFADVLADSDVGIARGDLSTNSQDLEKLLGRKPQSLGEAVRSALK